MLRRFTKFLDYRTLEERRPSRGRFGTEKAIAEIVGKEWKIAHKYPVWGGLLLHLERETSVR